jgi:hypothetical protein
MYGTSSYSSLKPENIYCYYMARQQHFNTSKSSEMRFGIPFSVMCDILDKF